MRGSTAFLFLFVLTGCGRDAPAADSQPSPEATLQAGGLRADARKGGQDPPRPNPSASEPSKAPTRTTVADVEAFVAKWARAQSAADFATYETLYAPKFDGVKRVGKHTERYGRRVWMADRKNMMKAGTTVEATDVKVTLAGTGAQVTFTQRFKSAAFEDVGPKQLVLVESRSGLRVAREEMLASVVKAGEAPPLRGARVFAADATGVFITAGLAEDAGAGAALPYTPPFQGVAGARKVLDDAKLTDEERAWRGREVVVHDAAGTACAARIASVEGRAVAVFHSGWSMDEEGKSRPPKDPAALAWEVSGENGRYLFGVFGSPCPGALFGVAGGPKGTFLRAASAQEPAAKAVMAAFRALPEYRKIQREAESHPDHGGKPWDGNDGEPTLVSTVGRFAVASARGGQGCGDFYGTLTAVFEFDGVRAGPYAVVDGALEVLHVLGALDLDGDGELELVTGPDRFDESFSVLRRTGKTYAREPVFSVPVFECGC